MRRIIRNKVYDTTTAKIVGHWEDSTGNHTETLYRKHSGEYFLEVNDRNNQAIEPVEYDRAKGWAGERLSLAEYTNSFGAPEAGTMVATSIALDAQLLFAVKRAASREGVSMKQWIADAVKLRLIYS